MSLPLDNTVALVTGASSGIGAAAARKLASLGAKVALVARRKDRLDELAGEIGDAAFAIEADITVRAEAEAAILAAVERFGRLDIVLNNAGLMLIGQSVGSDPNEWQRMVNINVIGLLNVTHAALPHLLSAAETGPRRVADLVNISSVAAFQFNPINGVYALTKAGVNAFSESLRQEVTKKHLRVGVIEPGSVATELVSHNRPDVQDKMLKPYFSEIETLVADDIAEGVAFMVTRGRHASVNKLWLGPTEQI